MPSDLCFLLSVFESVEVIWFFMKRMKEACPAASSGHKRIFYSKKGITETL